MGVLSLGEPLSWQETKKNADKIRKKGIKQFINLYNTFKNRDFIDSFKYGDEVEYSLVKFDHEDKRVRLLLKAHELLRLLEISGGPKLAQWTPEFGNFMIEGLPAQPYDHTIGDIFKIEQNMKYRRVQAQSLLNTNEHIMTFSTFPQLGCPGFTHPQFVPTPGQGIASSIFFPDDAIFQGNPRYATSVINNRERRKSRASANVPIFFDKNTPQPFDEDLKQYGDLNDEYKANAKLDHIYLDGIGASFACLQATFQARNMKEACRLYDQLTPLTPIVLALSASSPIWRGYLSEIDVRWKAISELLDDRTPEERGEEPLKSDRYRINKSRYDSTDCYISQEGAKYNDLEVVKDEELFQELINSGVDSLVAQHVAHLFIRDPLIVFKESLESDNDYDTDHFENIQSTNWQNMRFKPPPKCDPKSQIGWRVEFRTTELQTTDFENAAFVTFLVLMTRVILSFDLNLLVPISKVDENMRRAQKRNACLDEKFFFRFSSPKQLPTFDDDDDDDIEELSIDEIINGSYKFTGLIPLIRSYLSQLDVDYKTFCRINHYLRLIEDRASGKVKTTASWMRDFVMKHPKYRFDSKVSDEIAYDLMWTMYQVSTGEIHMPDLISSESPHVLHYTSEI